MNLLRILSLLILLGPIATAESPPIDPFQRKSLLRDWKTVRFGVYLDMGDYATRGNTILLQRLDTERATLSVIGEGSAAGWRLPVLIAVVPQAHATKLAEQALDFCATAKREEPEKGIVRNPTHRLSMYLDFITAHGPSENKERSYLVNFDLGAETHKRFSSFIKDAAKAPND